MFAVRPARVAAVGALLALLAAAWIATARARPGRDNPGRIQVEYARVGRGRVPAAYRRAIGSDPPSRGSPAPGCTRGIPDERPWSRPADPARVAGRFACRFEDGRAAMWWSDVERGVLVHAVARDNDLASLYAWWLSHPER